MSRPRLRSAVASLLALGLAFAAAAEPPVEYQVQAAYVSKFLRFVEWPEGAVEDGRIVVGVLGDADFWEAMQALDGHDFGGSRVEARRITSPGDLSAVQVLVVDPNRSSQRTGRYLRAAADRPILTVGKSIDFSDSGGIIEFVLVDDTLRFEINTEAADRAGLKLSSRLLRLARNVRGRTP